MGSPWFLHRHVPPLAEILPSWAKIHPQAVRRRSEVLFPPAWLWCSVLLWICCSGILSLPACLSYRALPESRGSQQDARVRAVMP
jgi:hypothetical protein